MQKRPLLIGVVLRANQGSSRRLLSRAREKSNLAQENSGNEGENYEGGRPANLPDQEEQLGLFRQPLWRFKQHIADKPQLRNHALRPVCVVRNVKHPHRSAESHPFFCVILMHILTSRSMVRQYSRRQASPTALEKARIPSRVAAFTLGLKLNHRGHRDHRGKLIKDAPSRLPRHSDIEGPPRRFVAHEQPQLVSLWCNSVSPVVALLSLALFRRSRPNTLPPLVEEQVTEPVRNQGRE
jgi:hypothetical protein